MNLLTASVLILSGILAFQLVFVGAQSQAVEGANILLPEPETPVQAAADTQLQTTTALPPEPMEITYPEPTSIPAMRPIPDQ